MIILKIILCVALVAVFIKFWVYISEEHKIYMRKEKLQCRFYDWYLIKNGYYDDCDNWDEVD